MLGECLFIITAAWRANLSPLFRMWPAWGLSEARSPVSGVLGIWARSGRGHRFIMPVFNFTFGGLCSP